MPVVVMEEKGKIRFLGKHPALRVALFVFLGLWALVLIVSQVALNSRVLTRIVGGISSEFVDGSLGFDRVSASMFKSFPYLRVTIDNCSLTYPSDRFSAYDDSLAKSPFLLEAGRGEMADTLACFDKFTASINYLALAAGKVRVRELELDRPRIFAKRFDSTSANWNMFRFSSGENSDTATSSLPPISVSRVKLSGKPMVVFASPYDTLFGTVILKDLDFRGRLTTEKGKENKVSFSLDSLLLAGRTSSDTLAFSLEKMTIRDREDVFRFDIRSDARLALSSAGRMSLPIVISGDFIPDLSSYDFDFKDINVSVAGVGVRGEAFLGLGGKNPYVRASLGVERQGVADLVRYFGKNFPALAKLSTDAYVSFHADCDGELGDSLPDFSARLVVPRSEVAYEGLSSGATFDIDATLRYGEGKLTADIPDFCLSFGGLGLDFSGTVDDILGGDPLISLESDIRADLDSLSTFIPDSLGIGLSGKFAGKVSGSTRVSDLDIYDFSGCGLSGYLESPGVTVSVPRDTVFAYLGKTIVKLGPERYGGETHREVGISASVDSMRAEYGRSMFLRCSGLSLSAHNSEDEIPSSPGKHPLHGHLDLSYIGMMDVDSTFIGILGSGNVFKYTPALPGGKSRPSLDFSSRNRMLATRSGVNRLRLHGLELSASATAIENNSFRKNRKLDSLGVLYPKVPRDSLFVHVMREAMAGRPVPDYLSEADFRKKDIDIHLSESIASYIRNWDLSARVRIDSGKVITPYFPLENRIEGFAGKLTNDKLVLENVTVRPGRSDLSLNGTLSGLKRALGGRGRSTLNLDLDFSSGFIDLDEILLAVNAGGKFVPPSGKTALEDFGDEEYLAHLKENAVADSVFEKTTLILPSNLNAKVSLRADKLRYSSLETSWLSSDIEMRHRCLRLTNTMVMSNMGEAYVEGFYSTKTKDDLKAGFDLTLSNITAEKVIELFPAVDSIVPMLKAFNGLLDCEVAATTSMDENMNILLDSMNGIVKVDGKNLELLADEELDKLRGKLMFKSRKSSVIDDMSIRGILKDNKLEIFPFVFDIDRYTMALSGVQRFDQTFKYHVSAIKTPVPFRFGVNVKGDFDNWGWYLGKAKYKSRSVPLFDDDVDEVRFSLLSAIHNIFDDGVDSALERTRQAQAVIEEKKSELDFIPDDQTEGLDSKELEALETLGKIGELTPQALD